jgi:drug/metabolite transporter (DMT)-like permease
MATEIFFTVILSYLFLHETPLFNELIGGFMIFIAASVPGISGYLISQRKGQA